MNPGSAPIAWGVCIVALAGALWLVHALALAVLMNGTSKSWSDMVRDEVVRVEPVKGAQRRIPTGHEPPETVGVFLLVGAQSHVRLAGNLFGVALGGVGAGLVVAGIRQRVRGRGVREDDPAAETRPGPSP